MQGNAKSALAALLSEAAEAHHHYETEVLKQADNDWAGWYAEYLMQHGAANSLRESLAVDQLAAQLTEHAAAYQAQKPAGTWQEYYAERLAG
jgi:hypothetical protein